MGRESKLVSIAWELKNLWEHLTRQELSEYYGISERTLYTYSKQLNLPKKIDRAVDNPITKTAADNPVEVWIHNKEEKNFTRHLFRNWLQFVFWTKAQSHPVILDTMNRDGKTYMTCKFADSKVKAAEKYEKELCKTLK